MSTEVATLESLDMAEVQKDVARFDAMLEQMKADYLPVLDIPITDKKQLEASKAARMNFKNTRLEGVARLDAGCKALYANWKLWVKARDTFEKKFSDVEELFRANEKAFEEAEERKFLEIAQAEQHRVAARKERMFQIGFKFDGSKYVLEGFAELTENEVSGLGVDDLQLGEWLNDLERQVAEHKERQEEEERTRRIAAEALAVEQKRKDEEAAAKLAEIERREKEMQAREAEMNAKVNEARKNELIAAGCEEYTDISGQCVGVPTGTGGWGHTYGVSELSLIPEENWVAIVQMCKKEREEYEESARQREIAAKSLRDKQEQERIAREEQLKAEAAHEKFIELRREQLTNTGWSENEKGDFFLTPEGASEYQEKLDADQWCSEDYGIEQHLTDGRRMLETQKQAAELRAAQRAVAEERERAQREREAEEKKKKLLEEQEREKALQASDREKVGYVTNSIEETIRILPEMKSSVGQHAMKTLAKQLSDIVKMLDNLSNEL